MQVLFGYLGVSQKKFYDTIPFCKALKEYDGSQLRLGEQKDINEFCAMLFDQLENTSPRAKRLLHRQYGGCFIHQIVSQHPEAPYTSEREEAYHMITLEVQGRRPINQGAR